MSSVTKQKPCLFLSETCTLRFHVNTCRVKCLFQTLNSFSLRRVGCFSLPVGILDVMCRALYTASFGLPVSAAGLQSPDTAWWSANNGLIPPALFFLFSVSSSKSGFSVFHSFCSLCGGDFQSLLSLASLHLDSSKVLS